MPLNQDVQFVDAPTQVKAAFSGGVPQKLLLQSGHQLYKFTQNELFHNRQVTPWWSSVSPINSADMGLEKLLEQACRVGVAPAHFDRVRRTLTIQWNSMRGLILASLKPPVYIERASRLAGTSADFTHAWNAQTKQWNSMSGLLNAALITPVYAFVGRAAHQRNDEPPECPNVVFIGSAIQLWIPNLTAANVRKL